MRQPDRGDRGYFERSGVENCEFGGVIRGVDDEAEEPAFVLTRVGGRWHEYEFARNVTVAEFVHTVAARIEIMLVKLRGTGELRVSVRWRGYSVRVAIALAESALVDARKFLRCLIDHAPIDAPRRGVHRPAFELAQRAKSTPA